MNNKQLPPLPTPKFTETIRGVPCITVTEHEHLMREYALQAITHATQAESEPVANMPRQTHGMNLGERIKHAGGVVADDGRVLFGSPMAVDALILQVLRDTHPAPGVPDDVVRDAKRYRWLKAYDHNSEDMGICKWVDEGWSGQWVLEHDPDTSIDAAMLAAS